MRSSHKDGNDAGCGCRETSGDRAVVEAGGRHFDADAASWLVGQAVARLNAVEGEGPGDLQRTIELLAGMDATSTIGAILQRVPREDVSLRWSLLYLLAETGDARAADLFMSVAAARIGIERDPRACEGPYDGEVLVRTMAVEGLGRLAGKDGGVIDRLLRVIEAQPDPAVRIEAVKAILAASPQEAERLRHALPEELHFALTLRHVRAQSLAVEHEADKPDAVRAMPSLDGKGNGPSIRSCQCCGGG